MGKVFVDSFSASVSDLKRGRRTRMDILAALSHDPMVSCWDLSEHAWLRNGVYELRDSGHVISADQPYPWCRFILTDKGRAALDMTDPGAPKP